ncbi:hypothetical protein MauCBS54593_006317 [Microsporum audouinii]
MTLLLGLFSGRGEPRSPFSALLMLASVLSLLLGLIHARDIAPYDLYSISSCCPLPCDDGPQLEKKSVSDVVQLFSNKAREKKEVKQVAVQACNEDSLSTEILGLFADTTGNLSSVQDALRRWNDAECLDSASWDEKQAWREASVTILPGQDITVGPGGLGDAAEQHIEQADTCSYTQAVAGDGCYALASRCKITQEKLVEYNGNPKLCETLVVGQYVCCSPGKLPDFSPQPNPDGSCKAYTIQPGDICDTIARQNSLTVDQINDRNKRTWGWAGCSYLMAGAAICLSTGTPPMPAPIANAVCGPQVPGTKKPADMTELADLNPCPLKVCCNVWGQCGINRDFCIPSSADTGAPGTAKPGSNGCISSCGIAIVNNHDRPANFMRVGYFEAWNKDRPCLHMQPRQIDSSHYTHIHFAFGDVTKEFKVDISKLQDMFDEFKKMKSVKRILSFGGWSFSTVHDTFPIFREGVTPEQRKLFADNVVKFIVDQGLDGVDFDWEYPGAPDIPGIPRGSKNDGPNYLE